MSKRVTPDRIISDYEKTGMKAKRRCFIKNEDCGCPATVHYLASTGDNVPDLDEKGTYTVFVGLVSDWFAEQYGADYFTSYWHGVDGLTDQGDIDTEGWRDGRDCWRAILEAGLVE